MKRTREPLVSFHHSGEGPLEPEREATRESAWLCQRALEDAERILRRRAAVAPNSRTAQRVLATDTEEAAELSRRFVRMFGWLATRPEGPSLGEPTVRPCELSITEPVAPSIELVLMAIKVVTVLMSHEVPMACAILRIAMSVTKTLAKRQQDCLFLCDLFADLWRSAAVAEIGDDHLEDAETCLHTAWVLAEASGGAPALVARLTITRAHIHWQRCEVQACLTELEVALLYCKLANDDGLRGEVSFRQGLALEALGKSEAARQAYERSLELLPGKGRDFLCDAAREQLTALTGPS